MSEEKYLRRDDPDFCLSHLVEECGELMAAIGKLGRWGPDSVDPTLPESEQVTNIEWVKREMLDVEDAIMRFRRTIEHL